MFDVKELRLMFLDPTDLIIDNVNRYLNNKKLLNLFFPRK